MPLASWVDVVKAVASQIHEVAGRRSPPRAVRRPGFTETTLAAWSLSGLEATVTVARYGTELPRLMARFRAGGKSLTIDVGVKGSDVLWRGASYTSARGDQALAMWLRGARRSTRVRGETWSISAESPEDVTACALAVFLWRAGLSHDVDVGPESSLWPLFRSVLGRHQGGLDEAVLFQVLVTLREQYRFPEDWRTLRRFAWLHAARLRALDDPQPRGEPKGSVPPRTWDRWIAAERKRSPSAPRYQLRKAARARGERRRERADLMDLLTNRYGKSREAARKWIARALKSGRSLDAAVGRLRPKKATARV